MGGMARRPEFAQKLLDDLRLRKERLAAAHGSRNTHARGDTYANSRQMIQSTMNGKGSVKYSPMHNQAARCQNPSKPTNQIVPFTGGRGTKHTGDFSVALAFAMENGGKLRMTDLPRNQNPMLSFLREMGRGSMDIGERRSITVQVPALSQLHVKEISKGAEKLNRILRAWSNGLNLDRCSVEIGKELLKGALDLQESLRMLTNLQGASVEFSTGTRQKNRIVLLEDGEDGDNTSVVKSNDNRTKQIRPPRFSFDKPERRDRRIQQSVIAVRNMGLPALTYPSRSSEFSISNLGEQKSTRGLDSNPVKERKTNVIAKLMGLEEVPANDAAAYSFLEGTTTTGVATSKPNSPPWPISPSIQVERANKSPLSQEISRMMMGSERKVAAPDTRAAKVDNSARSDPKMDDGGLKERRTIDKAIGDKNRKHEQGIMRNPDCRGPKDRKSMGTDETATRPRGKQATGQKLRADDKNGIPLQGNGQRERGDAKRVDRSVFLPKASEISFQEEKINNKKLFVNKNGPENRVPAEFADTGRTKRYGGMKTEGIPARRGGAQAARARERKEIPAPVLRRAEVADHLETKKLKEAAKKKGGLGEGLLRPLPRSSRLHGIQKIKPEEILEVSENIKLPQTDGRRSAESVPTVREEAERTDVSPVREILRTQIQEMLTETQNHLKRVLLGSQLFVDVARMFIDFDIIPPETIPAGERVLTKTDDRLVLDCGYEIAKRKGRLKELAVHPLMKIPSNFLKVATTLDDLIRQLSDCFERLTSHGRKGNPSCEAEEYVPRMFEADVDAGDPDTNCMWDFGWNHRAFGFVERDDVARTVEKMMIGGLIDEITRDLVRVA